MPHDSTPILLNLNPHSIDEPDISNDEFLDSLEMVGVWLRVFSANESLERYTSPDSSSVQRLAALANIYLQLGAQLEDQAVSLIAFSVWSKNRNLVLADLFSRIHVKRSKDPTAGSEIKAAHERLKNDNGKGVVVEQRAFFREVREMSDSEIIEFLLGYKWRAVPSVKLLPRRHLMAWKRLPGDLRRVAGSYYEKNQTTRLTAAYNKLKHGPQLVVQNPIDRAKRFGNSPDAAEELARHDSFNKPGIRMLFDGANTRSKPVDASEKSKAPFLIDDEAAAKKLFFDTMVHHANLLSLLVKMQIALYRKRRIDLDNFDPAILRIVGEQRRYNEQRV